MSFKKIVVSEKLRGMIFSPDKLAIIVYLGCFCNKGMRCESLDMFDDKLVGDLVSSGLVSVDNQGYYLADGSIFEKKKAKKVDKLKLRLLKEVGEVEIDESESECFKIARSFQLLFISNLNSIGSKTEIVNNAKYGKWVDNVRLMMDTDKVTADDFRNVYRFINKHHFWSSNVQSIPKLREKFQTIFTQMKADESGKGNIKSNSKPKHTERKDY